MFMSFKARHTAGVGSFNFFAYLSKNRCRYFIVLFILFAYFCLCGMCFFRRFPGVPKELLFSVRVPYSRICSALLYASRILAFLLLTYFAGCTVFAGPICCLNVSAAAFCYGFSASFMCANFGIAFFISSCFICMLFVAFSAFAVDFSAYAAGGISSMACNYRFLYYTLCFILFVLSVIGVAFAAAYFL